MNQFHAEADAEFRKCVADYHYNAFHCPIAEEHRTLSLDELISLTRDYVDYLNLLVRNVPGCPEQVLKLNLTRWPGMIGKMRKWDEAGAREFAAKNLRNPRFESPRKVRSAEWAVEPARRLIREVFDGSELRQKDPCGVIWGSGAFVKFERLVTADEHGEEVENALWERPVCAIKDGVNRKGFLKDDWDTFIKKRHGQKRFVNKTQLGLMADAVTCRYGPLSSRIKLYAFHMVAFLDFLDENFVREREDVLFAEIMSSLKAMAKSGRMLAPEVMSLKNHDNGRLMDAVDEVWRYAPLNLEDLPSACREKARAFYDFGRLRLKKKRWIEDVRNPLLRAMINEMGREHVISDEDSDEIPVVPADFVNVSKIAEAAVWGPRYLRQRLPRIRTG